MNTYLNIKLVFFFLISTCTAFSQEIRRIGKSGEVILSQSAGYSNAIASSKNTASKEIAYKNKDSVLFLKDLKQFFEEFEKSLREEEGSAHFVSNTKKMNYVLFVSNTGYTDSFYYEFEDGKNSMSFVVAMRTFIANHKWENPQRAKMMHQGIYTFK